MRETKTESDLKDLITGLKACNKLCLDDERRNVLKKSLMSKLTIQSHKRMDFSLYSLIGKIRLLAESIKLDVASKVMLKERVIDEIESHAQKRFFWSNFFIFSKKLVSATLLVVMVFGLMSFFNVQMAVTRAATFTTLDEFSGKVLIERGGRLIGAKKGMQILENDQVITGSNGNAVIRYFDDSISRLATNTKIEINKLVRPDVNSVNTYVEVILLDGTIWSRVINLVESRSAFVVRAMDVSTAAKKAAFNVEVGDDRLQIGVFNHTVDVKTDGQVEKVMSGEKMVVDNGFSEVVTLNRTEKNDVWVQENLESDSKYLTQVEDRLLEEKKKAVGVDSAGNVSFDNSLKQDTLLLLTFDDVKKQKMALDLAEMNFIGAQVKLHDVDLTKEERAGASIAIQQFADQIKGFYELVDKVALTDEVYAKELKTYIDNKVLLQKKDLSLVLPDSPAYPAKEVLNEVELLSATNEAELMQLKVDQAAEKLSIAEDVKGKGNAELASQIVDEYKKEMTGVVDLIDQLSETTPEVVAEMKEQVANNFDLLKAIDVVPVQKIVEVEYIVAPVVSDGVKVEPVVATGSSVGNDESATVVESGPVIEPEPEMITEGPYGVMVKGDKPLPPLLQNIE